MTTATTNPAIQTCGLVKSYGSHRVLDGLDLTVTTGRVHALLGRNGSGKSTTFKILLGLLRADSGSVQIFGSPWSRQALAMIGASVDGPAYYPQLSATENLQVHARLGGVPKERIAETLSVVGLAGTGKQRARSFSTGMKGRLALGMALLADPPILLLDEPQNGLDPQGIIELRQLLRELVSTGRTVLVSSHQLGEVAHLADDISILSQGRCVHQGPLVDFAPAGELEQAYLRATGEVVA